MKEWEIARRNKSQEMTGSGSCLGIEKRKVAEREEKGDIAGYFGKK